MRRITSCLSLAALFAVTAVQASIPLRITCWDLSRPVPAEGAAPQTEEPGQFDQQALDGMMKQAPDILFLQHAPESSECARLAGLLNVAQYEVLSCSALHDASEHLYPEGQVAILSKYPSKFSWSESLTAQAGEADASSFGYSFAAIQRGDATIGLFTIHAGAGMQPQESTLIAQSRKFQESLRTLLNSETNKVHAFIIYGSLDSTTNALRADEKAFFANIVRMGFRKNMDWLPEGPSGDASKPGSISFIYTKGVAGLDNLVFTPVAAGNQKPMSCDLRLEPITTKAPQKSTTAPTLPTPSRPIEVVQTQVPLPVTSPAEKPPSKSESMAEVHPPTAVLPAPAPEILPSQESKKPSETHPSVGAAIPSQSGRYPLLKLGGFVLLTLVCLLVVARILLSVVRTKPPVAETMPYQGGFNSEFITRAPDHLPASNQLAPNERVGAISQLALWMKQKVLQTLLAEREQFSRNQDAATIAVMRIDERLTNVEKEIRQRNQDYERRISELMKELSMAHEENRALIRAKIEALKAEMQQAQQEETDDEPPRLRRN